MSASNSTNPREHAFESFPEPRTFPAQWDTSEMIGKASSLIASSPEDRMTSFPEPRTIPDQWDVSAFANQPK